MQGIEVDIRLSKDSIPFLYHGETLEESTTGYGKPEDYTWDKLQQFTYKESHSKLISLDELLTIVGSQKYIFLDVKTKSIFNSKFAGVQLGLGYKTGNDIEFFQEPLVCPLVVVAQKITDRTHVVYQSLGK